MNAQGLNVDRVASASAAYALLDVAQFDVMILDLGLPDEDGISLLRRLRLMGQAIPVLILTARDDVDDRVKGLQAGADDYLLKPFDLRELYARLHTLLRRVAGRAVNLIEHVAVPTIPAPEKPGWKVRPSIFRAVSRHCSTIGAGALHRTVERQRVRLR